MKYIVTPQEASGETNVISTACILTAHNFAIAIAGRIYETAPNGLRLIAVMRQI